MYCNKKTPAPHEMARGSATTDGRFAYFAPDASNLMYKYELHTEKWEQLPSCPHRDTGLVIIGKELNTVGGEDWTQYTDKLLTLKGKVWVKAEYPAMHTVRSCPAIVSTSPEFFIVIGGYDDGGWITAVEMYQVENRAWYKLTELPKPLTYPSATICNNIVHVTGSKVEGYSCSLQTRPSSDQPITLPSWEPLLPPPVTHSTAATLSGQLVLIGGLQHDSQVNSIHQLVDGQWVEIGLMDTKRSWCLVATLSSEKLIVVGGRYQYDELCAVEECSI